MNLLATVSKKPKRCLGAGILALVLCGALAFFSAYFSEHPPGDFLPLEEATGDGQRAQISIQVLDTIATDSSQVYYFAAGPSSHLYLLTLPSSRVNGEFREMFNQSLSFDGSDLLDPITVYGTAHEIPDELMDLCLQTFNLPDETEFRHYFGYYYLDSTDLPANWPMLVCICLAAASGLCGLFCLAGFLYSRRTLRKIPPQSKEEPKL